MILRYFGEDADARCEGCDNCLGLSEGGAPSYPEELFAALLAVRDRSAERSGRDPLTVLDSRAIRELATYRPRDHRELLEVRGIGEVRVRWMGDDLLAAIGEWESLHPEVARPQRGTASPIAQRRPGGVAESSPYDDISPDDPVYRALREWRAERSRRDGVPAYTIFSDKTLRELAGRQPRDVASLLQTWGLGSSRVERFGHDLLVTIAEASGSRRL
jgi:ATP-dependent DNA helicase RecQ